MMKKLDFAFPFEGTTRPLGAAETATGVVRITPLAVDMKAVIIANGMIVRHMAYIFN